MKWHCAVNLGERIVRIQGKILRCVSQLWALQSYRRKLLAFPASLIVVSILFSWALQSNSCAFNAYFAIILFDVITLFGDLISQIWIIGGKPSTSFSFGFIRVEVLTHFSVLCLGLLLNGWAVKKSLELAIFPRPEQEIHTGRFIPGAILGGALHFFLSFNNNPFLKVYKVSSTTTTLQKYFQGICASFGLSLSSASNFALSPIAIFGSFSISTILLLAFALQTGPRWFDFVGGLLIIAAVFDALWNLTLYTAHVLLQTVPAHIVTQIEQSLREALTIEGVLEFRNELFWTLTYGQIAGTLHIRVRRDANEQTVLAKVYDKLQPLAPHLTIQVIKDDFGRPFGNLHILRDLDSSLTQVTVGRNSEISPIPNNAQGNHLIYTDSSRNHNHNHNHGATSLIGEGGISSTLRFSESSSLNHSSRSVLSSSSSVSTYQPPEITIHGGTANNSGNHLIVPGGGGGHGHIHNTQAQNSRVNSSPFVINGASGANPTVSQNLLLSSANYFPE